MRTLKQIREERARVVEESGGYTSALYENEAFQGLVQEEEQVKEQRAKRAKRKAKGNTKYQAIYEKAVKAGFVSAKAVRPIPMVVQTHSNMADDNSPVVQQEYVSEGMCGFGWVIVRDRKFGKWLKDMGHGTRDSYYGGVSVWSQWSGQSADRNAKWAGGFAHVLAENGIEAQTYSRLD